VSPFSFSIFLRTNKSFDWQDIDKEYTSTMSKSRCWKSITINHGLNLTDNQPRSTTNSRVNFFGSSNTNTHLHNFNRGWGWYPLILRYHGTVIMNQEVNFIYEDFEWIKIQCNSSCKLQMTYFQGYEAMLLNWKILLIKVQGRYDQCFVIPKLCYMRRELQSIYLHRLECTVWKI
jgi:hypothetical protein